MKRIKFISILALLLTMTQGAWAQTYTATFATGSGETGWTINPASGVEGTSVTVSYSGENKVKSVTVKGISAVTSAPTANNLTYTGSAQALVTAGTATYGTMVYSLDGETYSDAIPTATNAGNYTVYYKVDGGTDYTGTTAQTVNVTINKATGSLSLSTSSLSFTADDFSQDITVTRSGDGAITATSSNEAVAKVTVSGNVVTVHRAWGAQSSATITVSVAASDDFTAPADVTCSYTQAKMRTPGECTSADKGRFLGQWGYLWPKDAAAYTDEKLYAVVAYVGSCANYFDKCLCIALEDISDSKLPNATAHTTLASWASSRDVNVNATHYQTDNGGVYDYVNGGESTYKTRTSGVVKGWRLPTVCDWAYLMLGYGVINAIPSGGITHGSTVWGSFVSLRTAIDNATGGTSMKTGDYGCGTCYADNHNSTWHMASSGTWFGANENLDASWIYYYRAVFAY